MIENDTTAHNARMSFLLTGRENTALKDGLELFIMSETSISRGSATVRRQRRRREVVIYKGGTEKVGLRESLRELSRVVAVRSSATRHFFRKSIRTLAGAVDRDNAASNSGCGRFARAREARRRQFTRRPLCRTRCPIAIRRAYRAR
jgi:hypothetical protein